MLAIETVREISTTSSQTPKAINTGPPSVGQMASSPPKAVATPLPPRKPRKMDAMWPTSAATATPSHHQLAEAATSVAGRPSRSNVAPATATGAAPLATSSTKHVSPSRFPSTRPTFVAPTLPDPCAVMSMPRLRAMSTPKGMDPIR